MNIAVFISGIAAVMAQTILIREMLAFFSGNELISGIVLFLWLLFTGSGSLAYSKLGSRKNPKKNFVLLLIILALILPFSFLFLRYAPRLFSIPFGEFIGIHQIITISSITLSLPCVVFGALFPAASVLINPQWVYLIESLGSFLGGLILTFFLISFIPSAGIIMLFISILLFAGFLCIKKKILLVFSLLPLFCLIYANEIEFTLKKIQLANQRLIGIYESRYGNIAVTESDSQINFYSSGVFDFAYPDPYSAEEAVHYPLLLHKNPESVLLVGGGLGGGIEEVLKHPNVKRLIYLELDPEIILLARKYLKQEMTDDRLEIIATDGRFYIKKSSAKFDCIIINLPDPVNAQLNRYYTREFFQEAKRLLNMDGIFSIRVNYTPDILSPAYSQFLATIKNTLNSVFQNVIVLPVAKATYIAQDRRWEKDLREILKENIIDRKLNLKYVNPDIFDYTLNQEKIMYIENRLDQAHAYLNTDLKPVCYYFNTLLWGGITSENLKRLLTKIFNLPRSYFFLLLIPLLLFLRHKKIIPLSVCGAGATGISSEIILLIIFQSFHGYLYHWIGIIVGLFMLGLGMGTLLFIKKFQNIILSKSKRLYFLSIVQFTLGAYLLLILLFTRILDTGYVIAFFVFVAGFIGGIHFPLAITLSGKEKAGLLYGIDLLGASLGAILTTIIFIPILGIVETIIAFTLMNVIIGFGILMVRAKIG